MNRSPGNVRTTPASEHAPEIAPTRSLSGRPTPTRGQAARSAVIGSLAAVGVTLAFSPFADAIHRTLPALVLLVPPITAAVTGGRIASVVVAVVGVLAFATLYLPPLGSPAVDGNDDRGVAVLFFVVATATGVFTASTVEFERSRAASERARREVLERMDQQRGAMLRAVSHDLRTPLASIQVAATDLRAGTPFDATTRAQLLDLIVDQSSRLDRLVGNVLSLGRIEAGDLAPDIQPVDLVELIEVCADRLARSMRELHVTTRSVGAATDGPVLVAGDRSQLDQVVTNLLENAAAHGPPGSAIEVVVRRDAEMITTAVVDHGRGLDPAVVAHLFEAYTTTNAGPTRGIGLTICRSVIDAHGGTLRAEPTPGGGATFTFSLPAAP
jgi:K+-sensing histidine kinase KdpD